MFEILPYSRRNRGLLNYNPFRELENFEKNFWNSDIISEFKTDIRDNGDSFLLEADLPGFKKEDISIDIESGYLTISGERHSQAEEKDKQGNYVRCERSYGSFKRSFDVSGINTEDIKAEYSDGVLKLTMPKLEEQKPAARKLEIQ